MGERGRGQLKASVAAAAAVCVYSWSGSRYINGCYTTATAAAAAAVMPYKRILVLLLEGLPRHRQMILVENCEASP